MALFHRATITPSKAELITEWLPTTAWGPSPADAMEVIGAYRFDDPDGLVGIESHLVRSGQDVFHVPLTYRNDPVPDGEAWLLRTMEHSVLGTRWVYDGLGDPLCVTMLAAFAMTGQGEALGMVMHEGRWHIAPSAVRITGGGWTQERVPVDGFDVSSDDGSTVLFGNDRFELTVFRRAVPGPRPALGLAAEWDGQTEPVVLAQVTQR